MDNSKQLLPCVVITEMFRISGFLYFKNESVAILLNSILRKTNLGPIKSVVENQLCPEANIYIIPSDKINEIVEFKNETENT